MGLNKIDLIPVGMEIKAANTGGLKLLGGVLVKIWGQDSMGNERSSRQLAYVAEDVKRVFLSKQTVEDLGIINKDFPRIGAYSMDLKPKVNEHQNLNDFNEINVFKPCEGLQSNKCLCPKENYPQIHQKFVLFHQLRIIWEGSRIG